MPGLTEVSQRGPSRCNQRESPQAISVAEPRVRFSHSIDAGVTFSSDSASAKTVPKSVPSIPVCTPTARARIGSVAKPAITNVPISNTGIPTMAFHQS